MNTMMTKHAVISAKPAPMGKATNPHVPNPNGRANPANDAKTSEVMAPDRFLRTTVTGNTQATQSLGHDLNKCVGTGSAKLPPARRVGTEGARADGVQLPLVLDR